MELSKDEKMTLLNINGEFPIEAIDFLYKHKDQWMGIRTEVPSPDLNGTVTEVIEDEHLAPSLESEPQNSHSSNTFAPPSLEVEDFKIVTEIDKTTEKYKLVLKFVNGLLKNIDGSEIDDLIKFKGIDREHIIKPENKQLLIDMETELFELFDKGKCGYYKKTKNIVLNCLRGMCRDLGIILYSKQFTKTIKCKVTTKHFYGIRYE
jgi:hypothetical protein